MKDFEVNLFLRTRQEISRYLDAARESDVPGLLLYAQGVADRAMERIHEKAQLKRKPGSSIIAGDPFDCVRVNRQLHDPQDRMFDILQRLARGEDRKDVAEVHGLKVRRLSEFLRQHNALVANADERRQALEFCFGAGRCRNRSLARCQFMDGAFPVVV